MTSAETIVLFSAGPSPVLFAVAVATGQPTGGRAGFGPKLAGTGEEAAVWMGWTALSSRAFQNLPGVSLKQKEEAAEEEGLPAGVRGPHAAETTCVSQHKIKLSRSFPSGQSKSIKLTLDRMLGY